MKKLLLIIIALLFSYNSYCQCTITTLPYYNNFSTYGSGYTAFPTCWFTTCPNNNSLFINSDNRLVFYLNYCTAITPEFDSLINIKNLSMSFLVRHSSNGIDNNDAKMYIGVMDSPTDLSSFDTIEVLCLPIDVYRNINVNFNHYTGNGKYIAFRAKHHIITNLNIDYTPSCPAAYYLKSNTNANITKLSWLAGDDNNSSWWVYFKPNTSSSYDSVLVNTPYCTLSNLLPNTNYTAYLRTNCNNTISTLSSDTISFRTYCNEVSSLPYVENFNTYSSGSFPTCWYNYNSDGNTNTVYTAQGAMYFMYSTYSTRMAITPYFSDSISLNNSMLKFRFKACTHDTDTVNRPLVIGSFTNIEDLSSFDSITTVYANSNWKNIDLNLSKYDFTGNYIAFIHRNGAFDVGIDNIIIDDIPSCPRPINPKLDSVSTNSANISWELFAGDESLWKIYYKPTNLSSYDSVIANSNNCTLLNLIPSTNYQAYIVTICDTLHSQNSDTLFFRTNCATIDTLPFIENFTRTGINAYPICWVSSKVGINNPPGNLYMRNDGILVLPEIDELIDIYSLILRFNARNASIYQDNENKSITIGLMGDANDLNSFDSITSMPIFNLLNEYDIDLNNYTGNSKYIALRTINNSSTIVIDDLILDYRSNYCIRPDSMVAIQNSIDPFNVDISWRERESINNGYWVYSQLNNSNIIDSFYTTNNYITIGNLLPDTSYAFYLKTFCNIENRFITSFPIQYITPCYNSPINVFPYLEDFSSGFNCWVLNENGTLRETKWSLYNGYACYSSNYNSLYSQHPDLDSRLISPAFDFTSNMEMSFNVLRNSSYPVNTVRKLSFYLNSVPDTIGAVLLGDVYPEYDYNLTPYWDTIKYLFPINSFGVKYLIITGTNNGIISLDNILIKVSPTCPENYNPKITNYDENTISLSWENSIIVPQNWILAYQAIDSLNFNPDSPLATQILISDTSSTQITMSGLVQGEMYSFAIRPVCDSSWSSIVSARTYKNAQLPYFTDFSDSIDNQSWYISNGGAVNAWCISSAVNDSLISGNSLMISNDNGVTNAYTLNRISCVTASRKFVSNGANAYTLKFDLRMMGEDIYDYLKVFVEDKDTNYIGVADGSSYYRLRNYSYQAVLFGGYNNTCPTCPYYCKGDSITTTHTIQLGNQGQAGNIRKLIFVWYNDGGYGYNPPPAIDNISLTNFVKEIYTYDTICKATPYNFYGQNLDSTGFYTQEFYTANVLDSIIYLNLIVNPTYNDTIFAEICQGETYYQFGFNDSIAGFYTQNLETINGCDSIVNLNLIVNPLYNDTITAEICQGETYTHNGFNVSTEGLHTLNLQTINGCDSIVNLYLTFIELSAPINLSLVNIANYIKLDWNGNGDEYIIYKNNDSLLTTSSNTYIDSNVIDETNYCYKLKAFKNECESELSDEECLIFVSLNEVQSDNLTAKLYPNPTEGKAKLEVEGVNPEVEVLVYDMVGRLIPREFILLE
mgnify:FL=1